jgi:hypothetical protein
VSAFAERTYIPESHNDSITESYKEMGFSIRKLSVRLKEEGAYWWGEKLQDDRHE